MCNSHLSTRQGGVKCSQQNARATNNTLQAGAKENTPLPSTGRDCSTRLPSLHTWQREREMCVDADRRNRSLLTLRRRSSKPSSPNVDATTAGPPSSDGPAPLSCMSLAFAFVNFYFCLISPSSKSLLSLRGRTSCVLRARTRLSPLHTIAEAAVCAVHVPASRGIQKKQSCTAQRNEAPCRRDGSSCRLLGNSTCG